MAALLESIEASVAIGTGLIAPGGTETFTVTGSDVNTVLSLTGMLLPTNDGFVGLNSVALPTSPGQKQASLPHHLWLQLVYSVLTVPAWT